MEESTANSWLQEIESVDYWGPTFRAIYESGMTTFDFDCLSKLSYSDILFA